MMLRFSIAGLAIGLLVSALSMAWVRYEVHTQYAILHELNGVRDRLDSEWSRLLLEQATWSSSSRIEHLARTALHLHAPKAASVVMLKISSP